MTALSIAYSGISAARTVAATFTNNIVNAHTYGYQAHSIFTIDSSYNNMKVANTTSITNSSEVGANNLSMGSGTRLGGSFRDLSLGELKHTKDPLHLAINGMGYFKVLNPQTGSYRYTRNGRFTIDPTTRQLIRDGDVLSESIVIPENINLGSVTILPDGRVQGFDEHNEVHDLGQILIYTPINSNILENTANGLLAYPAEMNNIAEESVVQAHIPGTNGAGNLTQGALEGSNVNTEAQLLEVMSAYLWLEYCHQCVKIAYKADKLPLSALEGTIQSA